MYDDDSGDDFSPSVGDASLDSTLSDNEDGPLPPQAVQPGDMGAQVAQALSGMMQNAMQVWQAFAD